MTDTPGKKSQKDPEVIEKAARRRFNAEYKRRIALEAEQCEQPGDIKAFTDAGAALVATSSAGLEMALGARVSAADLPGISERLAP